MNEVILKWLASGTIGMVVCGSLWLARSVQHEGVSMPMMGQAGVSDVELHAEGRAERRADDLKLAAARNAARPATAARATVTVN